MDPMTMYLIASGIGAAGSALSGALSGTDQELDPFRGDVDAQQLLEGSLENIGALQSRIAGQSFALPDAYVQTPPGYFGGGLPMPIGLSGRDPAAGVGRRMSDVVSYGQGGDGLDGLKLGRPDPETAGTRHPTPDAELTGDKAVPRVGRRTPGTTQLAGADDALSALELLRAGGGGGRTPIGYGRGGM